MTQPADALQSPPEDEPGADLRTVLEHHGPVALATRIHIPDDVIAQLRDIASDSPSAGEIRERLRCGARDAAAWRTVTDTQATLEVAGLASCRLIATPLLGRDATRPVGWLLRVDGCEAPAAPADVSTAPASAALDVVRDLDASPLLATFTGVLGELVDPGPLESWATACMEEASASWTLECPPTGPSGQYRITLHEDLHVRVEVLDAGAEHPLRGYFEPASPRVELLLELVLPALDAESLLLGPAGVPAILEHANALERGSADRVRELVSERVDRELRALAPTLLAGVELAVQPAALCRRDWRLGPADAAPVVAEVLAAGGAETQIERHAGSLTWWTLRGPRVGVELRLPLSGAPVVVEELLLGLAPDSMRADDLAYHDDAVAPGTLVVLGAPVLDAALPPSGGDRVQRRLRLEQALRATGSLRVGPAPASAHISVGPALTFVASRADTSEPRLDVARMQTPLEAVWREFRTTWVFSAHFAPGVREGVCDLLRLRQDSEVEAALTRCTAHLGIDHPPEGRPDVGLWIELQGPDEPAGRRVAHLAFVADPARLWGADSLVAVGFVAAPELRLPAPDWLRDPTAALPSAAELIVSNP